MMFTESLQYLGVMIPSLATSLSPMLTQVITVKILHGKLILNKIIGSTPIVASLVITAALMNTNI